MSLLTLDLAWEEEARFEQTRREWRALYKALMSDVNDGPKEILAGAPKIAPYAAHPKDPAALVAEFAPKRLIGTNFWDVELRYSTEVDVQNNPLGNPPIILIESVKRTIPALWDKDNNPIINMAGDYFTEPAPERTITDLVVKVEKNVPLVLPDWIFDYPDCVNVDEVRIRGRTCAPGTLYFSAVSVGPEINVPGSTDTISTLVKSTPYTTVNFEIDYRRDGWTLLLPNVGYVQLVPRKRTSGSTTTTTNSQGQKKTIRTRGVPAGYDRARIIIPPGDYPAHPVFLDANGAAILTPTFDSIITLEYDLHDKLPFGLLPLK